MALSPVEVAQIAYQVGWRGQSLQDIVAIIGRESGYNPTAHRTDSNPANMTGDLGLAQINYKNADQLIQAGIISSRQDLFDPVKNLQAALYLFNHAGGLQPWAAGPGGWQQGGDPFYGTNRTAAAAAVQQAQSAGLLGTNWSGSTATGDTGGVTTARSGPLDLPSDTKIYNIAGTYDVYAVYDVGDGVRLAYKVDTSQGAVNWKQFGTNVVDQNQWNSMGITLAGDSAELGTLPTDTYKQFWDSIIDRVMGPYNPARNDPGVMGVLAEFAARPDMTESELQSKLQRTQWYQTHTQAQLDWNGLSQAEQGKKLEEARQQIVDTWYQFTGEQVQPNDPRVTNYLEDLASGKLGWGAFTATVKSAALGNPESTWSRQVRTEQEAQRQRGVDIENTAQNVRDTLQKWGVQWTQSEVMRWAKDIVEKKSSDQDLLDTIKQSAQVLYPWKNPDQETLQAAQPWLATYNRLMESNGDLQTPEIQRALTQGTPVFQFEQDLRKTDRWAFGTKNGRDELASMAAEVGRKMGYA